VIRLGLRNPRKKERKKKRKKKENVHFIPPLTINKDKKNEVLQYKLTLSLRPL
jgi:hypothetical protein